MPSRSYPSLIGDPYSADYVDSTDDQGQQAAERLLEHVTAALEIAIERVSAEGPAARVLIDAVGEDDLLVVGSRGHGGFSSMCSHESVRPRRAPPADRRISGGTFST